RGDGLGLEVRRYLGEDGVNFVPAGGGGFRGLLYPDDHPEEISPWIYYLCRFDLCGGAGKSAGQYVLRAHFRAEYLRACGASFSGAWICVFFAWAGGGYA